MANRFFPIVMASLLFCATYDLSYAQAVRGRIEGAVKDPQGQVVPNVALTITNMGTGETLKATSSGDGAFVVAEVKPGTYRVTAEAAGFNIPAKGFSTHSESSSLGGEEFGIAESSRR